MFTAQHLKTFNEFQPLSDELLERVNSLGEWQTLTPNQQLLIAGMPLHFMYCLYEGEIELLFHQEKKFLYSSKVLKGEIGGKLPFSRLKNSTAEGKATEKGAVIFVINEERFPELICIDYQLTQRLVGIIIDRSREGARFEQQQEKLLSLGKMSAGFAHELNNPIAAIRRSAIELKKHLGAVPEKFKAVMNIKADEPTVDKVNEILFNKLQNGFREWSIKEKLSKESALQDWLDDNEIDTENDLISSFLSIDFDENDLEQLKAINRPQDLPSVLNWLDNVISTQRFVEEINDASQRVSELVQSIKSFTHMDAGADFSFTTLKEGIESTLQMLRHEFKTAQVSIVFNWDDSLPKVKAMIGQMNQVFHNLLANAVDAIRETEKPGTIEIQNIVNGGWYIIIIKDSGKGIPQEIVNKIFDPFFTTKDIGKGTGLGLDIARRIIKAHKGQLLVESEPNLYTEFRICLPI